MNQTLDESTLDESTLDESTLDESTLDEPTLDEPIMNPSLNDFFFNLGIRSQRCQPTLKIGENEANDELKHNSGESASYRRIATF